ncbi:MAG: hypothetical protein FJW92_05675, partial [Actinobacteria bacterium]|nr:hypothetical protein [Actinomycetota bacterium]
VVIGPDARVGASVIGAGTSVGAGAMVQGSVLGRDVSVGAGARVTDLVVAGDGADIAPGTVVAGPDSVGTGATVPAG